MSMTEILEELPKLTTEERNLLFDRLNELEESLSDESPELLAAIDEARAEPESSDVSAEEMLESVKRWTPSK